MRGVPEEIPDAEYEQILQRVCAIDVAKDSGMVCTRLSSPSGRRSSRVWQVAATTNAVSDLAMDLVAAGVEKITVESTSDYWRIWFYLLEAAGLDVQLVNARDVKNVPGRPKTDKLDAVWLAKLTEKGLLHPSFVPPAPMAKPTLVSGVMRYPRPAAKPKALANRSWVPRELSPSTLYCPP